WTASNRPVNSSQSVTVRLTGCAVVTGGGGVAACEAGGLWPHPASETASSTAARPMPPARRPAEPRSREGSDDSDMDRTSPLNRAAPGSAYIRQLRKAGSLINTAPNSSKIVMHRTPRHALAVRQLHAR